MESGRKEKKRHFPQYNGCLFCSCLNFQSAIKISSIVMAILYAIPLYNYSKTNTLKFVINTVIIISILFLLIGINKVNLFCAKQFLVIYLIYLTIESIEYYIVFFIIIYLLVTKKSIDSYNLTYPFTIKKNGNNSVSIIIIYFTILIIFYLIEIYYYRTTGSYIEQMEDTLEKERKLRNLEENNEQSAVNTNDTENTENTVEHPEENSHHHVNENNENQNEETNKLPEEHINNTKDITEN